MCRPMKLRDDRRDEREVTALYASADGAQRLVGAEVPLRRGVRVFGQERRER